MMAIQVALMGMEMIEAEEIFNSASNERISLKHATARKRKEKVKEKNELRRRALDFNFTEAKEFFSMPKEDQRNAYHLSPYSLKRCTFNHQDNIYSSRVRAELIAKAERSENVSLKKRYIGNVAGLDEVLEVQDEGLEISKRVPYQIEILADELAVMAGTTSNQILENEELFMFLTGVYMPNKLSLLYEYIDEQQMVA